MVYADEVTTAYKIKDVADRSGFTTATLRYYEEVGLLEPAARSDGDYRLYDQSDLVRSALGGVGRAVLRNRRRLHGACC